MHLYLYPVDLKATGGRWKKDGQLGKAKEKCLPLSGTLTRVDPSRRSARVVFLSPILFLRRPPLRSCAWHRPSGLLVIAKRQCPGDVPSRVYTPPRRSSSYLPAQTACPGPRRPSAIFGAARRLPHACHAPLASSCPPLAAPPRLSIRLYYTLRRWLFAAVPEWPGPTRLYRAGDGRRSAITKASARVHVHARACQVERTGAPLLPLSLARDGGPPVDGVVGLWTPPPSLL